MDKFSKRYGCQNRINIRLNRLRLGLLGNTNCIAEGVHGLKLIMDQAIESILLMREIILLFCFVAETNELKNKIPKQLNFIGQTIKRGEHEIC